MGKSFWIPVIHPFAGESAIGLIWIWWQWESWLMSHPWRERRDHVHTWKVWWLILRRESRGPCTYMESFLLLLTEKVSLNPKSHYSSDSLGHDSFFCYWTLHLTDDDICHSQKRGTMYSLNSKSHYSSDRMSFVCYWVIHYSDDDSCCCHPQKCLIKRKQGHWRVYKLFGG